MRELKALLPYLRRYRGSISLGLGAVVVSNAVGNLGLEYVKYGVDALDRAGSTRGEVARYAAISVVLALLAGAGRFWMRQILNSVSRRVELDLRDDFFHRLLRLDAGFYAANPTGEIMSRATNDIAAVRMVAGPAYMYLANTLVFGTMALVR
ncbi:ABC transporter transmembrane domain-containing protein, partial [Longimicrobium sp.]|uniref:ABC transporter transmembrane domain-containing protein n=1 Tax=Longimicrobium sp. TaxID=2029185 RepID=UPI002E3814C3